MNDGLLYVYVDPDLISIGIDEKVIKIYHDGFVYTEGGNVYKICEDFEPVLLCQMKNSVVHDIFIFVDSIICWIDNRIEVIRYNKKNKVLCQRDDIKTVLRGSNFILIQTVDNTVLKLLPVNRHESILGAYRFHNIMSDKSFIDYIDESELSTFVEKLSISDGQQIATFYNIILTISDLDDISMRSIDILDSKDVSKDVNRIFPLIFDKSPYIKIFGVRYIDKDFSPCKFKFLYEFLKDEIYYTLLCLKYTKRKINVVVPKFIRIEIVKWIVLLS